LPLGRIVKTFDDGFPGCPNSGAEKRILEPSGDQSILSATPPAGAVTRRTWLPSALATKIADLRSPRWRRNAMCFPSGENVGLLLSPATRITRNPVPPVLLIAKPGLLTQMRRPSGDHEGSPFRPRNPMPCRPLPSALTVVIS